MGLREDIETAIKLLAELNKSENNAQLKKVSTALNKLQKQMEKHRDNARRDLIISSALSALGAFVIAYFLKHYL